MEGGEKEEEGDRQLLLGDVEHLLHHLPLGDVELLLC